MTTTQKFVAPIVVILYLALLLLGEDTLAFSVGPGAAKKPTTSPLSASLEPSASEDGSRRSFLTSSVLAVLSAASVAPTLVVCADDGVDDLSMPSEEEQKMAEVSIIVSMELWQLDYAQSRRSKQRTPPSFRLFQQRVGYLSQINNYPTSLFIASYNYMQRGTLHLRLPEKAGCSISRFAEIPKFHTWYFLYPKRLAFPFHFIGIKIATIIT